MKLKSLELHEKQKHYNSRRENASLPVHKKEDFG